MERNKESLVPIKKFTIGFEPSLVELIKEKILADKEFEGVNIPRLKDILKGIDIYFTKPDLPDSLPNHEKFMQHVYDAVMNIDAVLEDKMDQIDNLKEENEELRERIEELENIVQELAEEAGIHPDDVL